MRFKKFYAEVITTTSIGGANAQHANKVGDIQRRDDIDKKEICKCKICDKMIYTTDSYITTKTEPVKRYHKECKSGK